MSTLNTWVSQENPRNEAKQQKEIMMQSTNRQKQSAPPPVAYHNMHYMPKLLYLWSSTKGISCSSPKKILRLFSFALLLSFLPFKSFVSLF